MRDWILRIFTAHFLSSYFAFAVLIVADLIFKPSLFTTTSHRWALAVFFGIFAPLSVPYGLALERHDFLVDPALTVQWIAYLAGFLFALTVFWRAESRSRRDRERIRLGLCRSCGYDLRATPDV